MGAAATEPVSIWGIVVPQWHANLHPAAGLLKEYAQRGCPVSIGRNWMLDELEAAVEK